MKKLTLGILCLGMLFATPAFSQDLATLRASWTPPTEGSPVERYILQVSTNGSTFQTLSDSITNTTYTFEAVWLQTYVARVAGIDALDRQGLWSELSDPYVPDQGEPGPPSIPVIEEVLSP